MSNRHIEMLMEAVAKLQSDVEWLKKGMMGMYASMGVCVVTLITSLLLKK